MHEVAPTSLPGHHPSASLLTKPYLLMYYQLPEMPQVEGKAFNTQAFGDATDPTV